MDPPGELLLQLNNLKSIISSLCAHVQQTV